MKRMTLKEIAALAGGTASGDAEVSGITIDSRKAAPGFLYIAIKGENHDGHVFIPGAVENGAVAVMAEREPEQDVPYILVADTRQALLDLAHNYRRGFDIPIVGLTGSVGKTTTKEMVFAVLSEKFDTLKTEGNLNNEIGLPLTLLRLEESTQAAVIEMGMSNLGEISVLSLTTEPTLAIISNIGVSHMESLGSRENILKAKLEILDGLREGCPILLNGDDPYLAGAVIEGRPVYYFGINDRSCDFRAEDITQDGFKTEFTAVFDSDKKQRIDIPVIGIHNVYNALAAFGAGLLTGVSPESAARGLSKYVPSGMRQRVREVNDVCFIEDCYNASPDSQRAALKTLASVNAQRRIAVLGDMLELGSISRDAHRGAGLLAARNNVDILFTYGEMSKETADNAIKCGVPVVRSFTDKRTLADALFSEIRHGDAVLFKASRGMALEDVIKDLYSRMEA
ncbi:MAG: UDP-N-acetylmuramoyl-tripeptide--D-alanyl-D-alanine ligase [Clostridia bacterium]|nr:UDP-N-acetylmuramoyl-tripeptide--D-alanyl-D-alanine ligase [Clostridia bacterium]